MQTAHHPTARPGRIRRLLIGDPEEPPGRRPEDRLPLLPETLDLAAESPVPFSSEDRLGRLETGIRLLAEALKRVHQDLSTAVGELREDLRGAATTADVMATVSDAVLPLQESMDRLAEATQSLPLILGAATERLASRIDATRVELEETVIALMAAPGPGGDAPSEPKSNGRREREIWGRSG